MPRRQGFNFYNTTIPQQPTTNLQYHNNVSTAHMSKVGLIIINNRKYHALDNIRGTLPISSARKECCNLK